MVKVSCDLVWSLSQDYYCPRRISIIETGHCNNILPVLSSLANVHGNMDTRRRETCLILLVCDCAPLSFKKSRFILIDKKSAASVHVIMEWTWITLATNQRYEQEVFWVSPESCLHCSRAPFKIWHASCTHLILTLYRGDIGGLNYVTLFCGPCRIILESKWLRLTVPYRSN